MSQNQNSPRLPGVVKKLIAFFSQSEAKTEAKAEPKLRSAEASATQADLHLQAILNAMHDAVMLFDLNGVVVLANPRVESLLGFKVSSIVGKPATQLLSDPSLRFAERMGFDGETLVGLLEMLRLNAWQGGGRLPYRLDFPKLMFIDRTMVAVNSENGLPSGLLMVFADVTEERRLSQAREDLSRMIVHDLRSPLTALTTSMRLMGEMAPEDVPLGKAVRKITVISQRALRKLLGMVDSLLDVAKMESGVVTLETEVTHLKTLADNVRGDLQPLAYELDIRIDILIPTDFPEMLIDPEKVERILLNLVDNALKFTPEGGVVQIRASLETPHMARIEVTDTGSGVPDEAKSRIFDRYEQADSKVSHRRGTGLGLTFCRLAVEAHGGEIWIEDNPGGGSIFVFTLPLETQYEPVNYP